MNTTAARTLPLMLTLPLLVVGCLRPTSGTVEEEGGEPSCGVETVIEATWSDTPLGVDSPAEVVAFLAGAWRASATWSDGAVGDVEVIFADRGENLSWGQFDDPEPGIAPHQCERHGAFDLPVTVNVPSRGGSMSVMVTFDTTAYQAGRWTGYANQVADPCGEAGLCHVVLALSMLDPLDVAAGWSGTVMVKSSPDGEVIATGIETFVPATRDPAGR